MRDREQVIIDENRGKLDQFNREDDWVIYHTVENQKPASPQPGILVRLGRGVKTLIALSAAVIADFMPAQLVGRNASSRVREYIRPSVSPGSLTVSYSSKIPFTVGLETSDNCTGQQLGALSNQCDAS